MRFSRFIPSVFLGLFCFPVFWNGLAQAQVPLVTDVLADQALSDSFALEWRFESAERSLTSGLPGIAAALYRSLLDKESQLSEEKVAELRLGLAQALLEQGAAESARAQIESVPEAERSARHALFLALSIFGDGDAVDQEAFNAALDLVDVAQLYGRDLPWYSVAEAFSAELEGLPEAASAAYQRAIDQTTQPMLRAHFESLILRQRVLSAPANENLAAELRANINKFEGQAAYPFVREYAVVLYNLGRVGEAIEAIERELENATAGYAADEREQLRLLKGLILGAESERGREALKALLRTGRDRESMGIALQLLARAQGGEDDLLEFLTVMISQSEAHALLGQMYYLRSQLALRRDDLRAVAESDARTLLEQFPGLSEITNVYRLLAFAALEKEPAQYRAAADFLIQMRGQTEAPADLVELNRLIGDCYFLNGDYANAVDFYSAARSREIAPSESGDLFLRLVSALLKSGSIDRASRLIDEADFGGRIDPTDRWRAEWDLSRALYAAGELETALSRVRLLLADISPGSVPTALDFRIRWLEAKLSLELGEMEGLRGRVDQLLVRLNSLPVDRSVAPNAMAEDIKQLLETEFLLLQGNVRMREGDSNAGRAIFVELRASFPTAAAAQRSYLIEAGYHGLVGDFVSAQATLLDLVEAYPESVLAPQALFEAAIYCERRGAEFFPQAIRLHNDLAEQYPDDPLSYPAQLKQGNLLRSMNDFAGAQTVYENLINGFPAHPMRYLAELSRADCMLAIAGNELDELLDVVVVLERLLDLPNLPVDFQAEASYKWAFTLSKAEAPERAQEVLSLSVDRFLLDGAQAAILGPAGRYWVARSLLLLGDLLEQSDSTEEARRVYRKMIDYNLPGRHIALSRVDQILDSK